MPTSVKPGKRTHGATCTRDTVWFDRVTLWAYLALFTIPFTYLLVDYTTAPVYAYLAQDFTQHTARGLAGGIAEPLIKTAVIVAAYAAIVVTARLLEKDVCLLLHRFRYSAGFLVGGIFGLFEAYLYAALGAWEPLYALGWLFHGVWGVLLSSYLYRDGVLNPPTWNLRHVAAVVRGFVPPYLLVVFFHGVVVNLWFGGLLNEALGPHITTLLNVFA